MHCFATVVLRKQLNFTSAVIRSKGDLLVFKALPAAAIFGMSVAEYTEKLNKTDNGLKDLQRESAALSHLNAVS